jgi:hypothetical protein
VTVQTKSDRRIGAAVNMSSIIPRPKRRGRRRFERAARATGLRQIVAKIPIKTGITVPPAFFRICVARDNGTLPIASNLLMYGRLLMKLAAGRGKS